MTCILPPELDDHELLMYLDGEADPHVTAHLEQCPDCRKRAERLTQWQAQLSVQLYRFTCPSPLELGEYHLGILPHDQAAAVTQHLAECPHCTREVAQLKNYLAELAPSLEPSLLEQVKERARVVIARLVSGGEGNLFGGSSLAPAYAGIRGAEAGPYLYQAEDTQIAIEVQDDAQQPGRKAILGLAMGQEPSGLAFLWGAERRIAVVPVDDLGNFVIPGLIPGSYELILSGPAMEIHIQELQVGTG